MFSVRITGEYGCFTRPEYRSERVSYEVPTPAAIRGILEAILWKRIPQEEMLKHDIVNEKQTIAPPAFRYNIKQAILLKEPKFTTIKLNELSEYQNIMINKSGGKFTPAKDVDVCDSKNRTQRNNLILKDVDFVASFTIECINSSNYEKYQNMFIRRITKGQYFKKPYIGIRQYVADVTLLEDLDSISQVKITRPLGNMFYDFDYTTKPPEPIFFKASIVDGVITYPTFDEARNFWNS